MERRLPPIALICLFFAFFLGCRLSDKTALTSDPLKQVLGATPPGDVSDDVWADVRAFYEARQYSPVWVEHKDATERATKGLTVLRQAPAHGFVAEDYGESEILALHGAIEKSDRDAADRFKQLAQFEGRLTSALLALGRDVALGRSRPEVVVPHWKSRRTPPDFVAAFQQAIDSDITEWLTRVQPPHAEYKALQKALADLTGQAENGGWPTVSGKSLKPGQSGPAVAALRKRLIASGHLAGSENAEAGTFDDKVVEALKSFQELHAIKATGRIDAPTLAAMNVPIEQRIAQVAVNLERWRWMPDDFGARHFLVNIPQYHLIARENGKPVMDIRVVVGKRGNETPIFSDEMEVVVFSPFWNIPASIVSEETAPAMMRDPSYLARNNMEIVSAGRVVDPGAVNWSDPSSWRKLSVRQRPGASNALGHVKFLFPNDFDVYLHDTPADSLFSRSTRAFSHGCVRVEEPEALAQYVLRDRQEWPAPSIKQAMYSGVEKHVKLESKIPVHIVYFTTWVDERGGLHVYDDIYGYDEKQMRMKNDKRRSVTHARR